MTVAEETKLVQDAVAGDQDAFTALYQATRPMLFSALLRLTKNHEDAEDLTAEAFAAAFTKLPKFRGNSRFSTWLHRIGKNLFLMAVRRGRTEAGKAMAEAVSLDCPIETASNFSVYKELVYIDAKQRGVALHELPKRLMATGPAFRMTLILHEIYGLTMEEIAQVRGVTVGCTKSNLHRSKVRARVVLKDFQCF